MSDLSDARAVAAERRRRLVATAQEVQARISPATLANDAIDGARARGEAIADTAIEAVKSRPIAVSAAAAGVSALIGFKFFRRFRGGHDEDERS